MPNLNIPDRYKHFRRFLNYSKVVLSLVLLILKLIKSFLDLIK